MTARKRNESPDTSLTKTILLVAAVMASLAALPLSGLLSSWNSGNNDNNAFSSGTAPNEAFAQPMMMRPDYKNNSSSHYSAVGTIASIQQGGASGDPAWIVSGIWRLKVALPETGDGSGGNQTAAAADGTGLPGPRGMVPDDAQFRAAFRMVRADDGSAMHRHTLSDFKLLSWAVDNRSKVFDGTMTVSLRDGPKEDVPVAITIRGEAISIAVDTDAVDHFGSTPIYGAVLRAIDGTGGRMLHGASDHVHGGSMGRPANATAPPQMEGLTKSTVSYFGNSSGYLVYPERAGGERLPAVIMIHEWWGLNQHIKNTADQLAAEGYVVLAADLFGGRVATEPSQAMALTGAVRDNPGQAIENLQAAVRHVSSLQNVDSSKVASIGWCFGGAWSLQLALNTDRPLAATVMYYGNVVTNQTELAEIDWPVLGIFGSEDRGIPVDSVRQFDAALDAAGVANEIHIYDGVGHAFANPSGDNYSPQEAKDAWEKTLAFLERSL